MNQQLDVAAVVTLVSCVVLAGCAGPTPTSASPASASTVTMPVLRLVNSGAVGVSGLIVIFPDERVEFGDVAAGATTTYRAFSKGVYRYAAYQAQHGDRVVTQPVVDWVGEVPVSGEAFTYTIEASEGPPWGVHVRLLAMTRDR